MRFQAVVSMVLAIVVVATISASGLGAARDASASTQTTSAKHKKRKHKKHKAKKPVKKVPAAPANSVLIQGYAFKPGVLTIKPGATVTWLFRDDGIAHWVISESEAFSFQSTPQTSGSLTVRFPQAGSYDYSCSLHPWMKGEIVVATPAS